MTTTANDSKDLTSVDRFSRRIGETFCWLFLLAAALTCYEVFVDWAFRAPTVWVHDSTIMLCSTCFLLAGAYALQRREHIRITVIYDAFSPAVQRVCDVITSVLSLTYLGVLTAFTGQQPWDSILRVERSGRAWDFPMPMVIRTALFLGALLLTVQMLAQIYVLIKKPGERSASSVNPPRDQ